MTADNGGRTIAFSSLYRLNELDGLFVAGFNRTGRDGNKKKRPTKNPTTLSTETRTKKKHGIGRYRPCPFNVATSASLSLSLSIKKPPLDRVFVIELIELSNAVGGRSSCVVFFLVGWFLFCQ